MKKQKALDKKFHIITTGRIFLKRILLLTEPKSSEIWKCLFLCYFNTKQKCYDRYVFEHILSFFDRLFPETQEYVGLNCCAAHRIHLDQGSSVNRHLKIIKIAPPLKSKITLLHIYFLYSSLAMIRKGKSVHQWSWENKFQRAAV